MIIFTLQLHLLQFCLVLNLLAVKISQLLQSFDSSVTISMSFSERNDLICRWWGIFVFSTTFTTFPKAVWKSNTQFYFHAVNLNYSSFFFWLTICGITYGDNFHVNRFSSALQMRMFLSIFAKGVMIWENENFYVYKVLKSKSFRWRLGRVNCRGKYQKWLLIRDPWPLKITWPLLCNLCHNVGEKTEAK